MSDLDSLRDACRNPLPHPDIAQLEDQAHSILAWIFRHYSTLPLQPIGNAVPAKEMARLFDQPLTEAGEDFASVLDQFDTRVSPNAFRVNHPRFFGFIPGVPSFLSMLGDILCSGSNFFAGVWLEASGPAQVELIVLDWFRNWLGLPDSTRGVLTSGGSEANLLALVVARDQLGFEDRSRAVLYLTEQRHWSIDRAAHVAGLAPSQVHVVTSDNGIRVSADDVRKAISQDRRAGLLPWLLVANAGATNTGAIDDLEGLADLCRAERLWFHVDAAYGWSAILHEEHGAALRGIDRVDSITLDPHKWLAQTFDAGCVLVREGTLLSKSFTLRPDYLQDVEPNEGEVNFGDHGIALTRRFRALKIWLSLKVLGLGWFRTLIDHSCKLAEFAEHLLSSKPAFEILSSRQLSIVCFRHVPEPYRGRSLSDTDQAAIDEHNLRLSLALQESKFAFQSTTRLRGRVALRLCFVNWRSTSEGVEQTIELLEELARDE